MVKTKVDYRKAMNKLRKAQLKIAKAGDATIEQLANYGKSNAKAIAPYFSGKTARLIRAIKFKGKDGMWAEIQSPNSTPGKRWKGGVFNLPRWMHATNGIQFGRKHIRSGDPRYMYRTTDYLNRIKKGVADGHFNKVKIR